MIVGSKNFTEQIVLGELVAQVIERQGVNVERRFNLGGTAIAHQALLSGGIDAYVEYSGTSLTAIFNLPPSTDSNTVLLGDSRSLRGARRHRRCRGLATTTPSRCWSAPSDAERLGLKTIGDLNKFAGARAGFGYEFLERPDGFTGLSAAYGLQFAGQPRTMDLNLIYRAVAAREIDVTAGDATSGQIESLHLVVLDDDRHYFPVVRRGAAGARERAAAVSRRSARRCGAWTARFPPPRCGG